MAVFLGYILSGRIVATDFRACWTSVAMVNQDRRQDSCTVESTSKDDCSGYRTLAAIDRARLQTYRYVNR
jgi:hypothetical protein